MTHQDTRPTARDDAHPSGRQDAIAWPAAAMEAETFHVEFGIRTGLSTVPADSFQFVGKGDLVLDGDTVRIHGSRRRAFRPSRRESHAFDRRDIVNAAQSGKVLHFQLLSGQAPLRKVQLSAANEAQARAMLARLPAEQTPEFAQAQAELSDFHERLARLGSRAPVTPTLVALNVAVFVAMCLGGMNIVAPDGETAARWGSNFGPLTLGGQWWRLFTATFIHFGVIHLAFNMWALFQSGRTIERLFGSARFVLLYVFAGLAGSLASLLWNPMVNSAGASGAIFGIFGGLLAFVAYPRNGVPAAVMAEHRNSTLLFAGYSLFYGFSHSGIDNAAHLGGLAGGFAMGLLLARPLTDEARATPGTSRLLAAIAAGLALLALMAWPLANPSGQAQARARFERSLTTFSEREKAAVDAAHTLFTQAKDGALPGQALASRLQQDVMPQWDALHDEIAAARLAPGSSDYPLQQALLRYAQARREELRVYANAFSGRVAPDEQAAKAARQNTETALAELNHRIEARK